jgi:hypothetical protein
MLFWPLRATDWPIKNGIFLSPSISWSEVASLGSQTFEENVQFIPNIFAGDV